MQKKYLTCSSSSSSSLPLPLTETAAVPSPRGTVVSVGSFTKICAPGLRLGWLEASPDLLDRISRGYIKSGGGVAPLPEAIVGALLDPPTSPSSSSSSSFPLDRHLSLLRSAYAARAAALVAALRKHPVAFPEIAAEPTGGYFCWVRH